jgi:AraC family transcriptional regulator
MEEKAPVLPRGRFYGITSALEMGGVTLSDVYHASARELPLHGHEAAYFCMLLEGEYRERCGDTEMTYGPFTIVFHAVGMRHTDAIGAAGARFFIVELDEHWADLAHGFMAAPVPVAEVRGGEAVWTALRLYLELRGGTLTELVVESALYELIGGLRVMHPVDDEELDSAALVQVAAVIDRDFAETLSLAGLAGRVGLHPVHLARLFRGRYHRSVGEYLHGRRVQAASQAMLETDRPIAEIAVDCGFFDQSHFTRVFKSVTGATPSEYRKRVVQRDTR